jgi:DNA polymerase III epsilon subunit-like protein
VRRAIVLDTETTGFSPHQHRVVEIAVVDFETGDTLLHTYLDPGEAIPEDASAVHGITWDQPTYKAKDGTEKPATMVKGQPTFDTVALELATIIQGAEAIIGYNPWFDRGMIAGEYRRLAQSTPGDVPTPRWPTLICAKRQWDLNEPREQRHLTNAYKRFVDQKGFDGAHGAMADTTATREVLIAQIFTFGLEGKSWEEFDPDQKRWCGPSDHVIVVDGVLVCNFGKYKGRPCHEIDLGYWRWIAGQDFPEHVKTIGDYCVVKKGPTADELYGFAYGRFM